MEIDYSIDHTKPQSKIEDAAARMALDALRSAQSELAILANHIHNERKKIVDCSFLLEADFELCEQLGFEPGSEAAYMTVCVKPYLDYLRNLVKEDRSGTITPFLPFPQLVTQMIESRDNATELAILSIVKDSGGLYSEDEAECMEKVYQSKI